MRTRILKISCADARGLVAKITGVLFRAGCNIVENGEFVDPGSSRFFFRAEFEGETSDGEIGASIAAELPAGAEVTVLRKEPKSLVVLVTKEPYCLADLLVRCAFGDLDARVEGVLGNHPDLEPLCDSFHVPFRCVPHRGLAREEHEDQLLAALGAYRFDYLVLAKYMRVLTSGFVRRFPGRIVNIHHSFLPAFVGADPYRQAFDRGVKIIGATAHLVNEELDEGPILHQATSPIDHRHTVRDLVRIGRDLEKSTLARALHLVLEERVFVDGRKTIIL